MGKETKQKDLTFEQAIQKLEKIVTDLEVNDLNLEEAVSAFEEGIKLSKVCNEKLNKAESKISKLMQKDDNTIEEVPFNEEEEVKG